MAMPYVETFRLPGMPVMTSLVLDREQFQALAAETAAALGARGQVRRPTGHPPLPPILMLERDAATQPFFERFGVPADAQILNAIERGQGVRFVQQVQAQRATAHLHN